LDCLDEFGDIESVHPVDTDKRHVLNAGDFSPLFRECRDRQQHGGQYKCRDFLHTSSIMVFENQMIPKHAINLVS